MMALLTDFYRGFSIDIKYTDFFDVFQLKEIFVHAFLFEFINRTPAIFSFKIGRTTYILQMPNVLSIA
jgi:hypothetical protein